MIHNRMEEEALRKDLEVVEDELLVLGAQIDDMLQVTNRGTAT